MKAGETTSADLWSGDFRLDGSYYASEGIKAARILRKWAGSTKKLDTLGSIAFLFNGPRFPRIYVEDPEKGIPFLSSSDMLLADLSGVKHLSNKLTPASLLQEIKIKSGWTLISCSGTIGNTVYVRQDMAHMTGSQHIMRAAPKEGKILSGYLYSFLSSDIAYSLLTRGTYGAVIRHIEPKHIENLPVPRLDLVLEERIHHLIEQSADLRVIASHSIQSARALIEREVGFLSYSKKNDHAYTVACAKLEFKPPFRLDSFYYSGYCAEALDTMAQYPGDIIRAQDVGYNFYNPPLFKRQFAQSGHPYMSGVNFYSLRPHTDRYLSKNQPDIDFYLVRKGTVLMQNAGQRYGLITTPLMVTRVLDGVAVTSDVIRIDHKDLVENGYICALFGSGFGRRLALRYSYGTSIPRVDVPEFSNIRIPWPKDEIRRNIGQMVIDAYQQYDLANQLEDQAQELLKEYLGIDIQ